MFTTVCLIVNNTSATYRYSIEETLYFVLANFHFTKTVCPKGMEKSIIKTIVSNVESSRGLVVRTLGL